MVARMVRDHEAMGSNPVTPTKGKTMKTSSFFIFCRKCVALPLFRRLSAALGLFKCFALAPPSLAVTPTRKNTHALFGVVCFLFARNKGFERDVKKTAQCAVFSPRRDSNRVSGAKKGA